MSISGPPAETAERQAYYDKISKRNLNPLWSVMSAIITREPRSACVPHLWNFAEMKELLLEAGALITAKEAERRVLMLENPGMPGQNRITTSLYAGLQLVLPGEGRAGPPPQPVGGPLRAGRGRRPHLGGWRAHHHGGRRLRHHPAARLARPRQPQRPADDLARRARHPDRLLLRRLLRRILPGRRAAGDPAGRPFAGAVRRQHAARSITRRRSPPPPSSTIPMPAPARRWRRCAGSRSGTRATG